MLQRAKSPIFVPARHISRKAKHNWRQVLGGMETTSGHSPCKDNNVPPRANIASLERGTFLGKYTSPITLRAESSNNKRPLAFGDGPMVWIDCEMTGLNPKKDCLLEIAVLITDGNLDIVDEEGISFTIKTDKEHLDNMDEWCVRQHGESGLTAACLESPHDLESVSRQVLAYVQRWVPKEGTAVLAGNSVHFDKVFLSLYMPGLVQHLHYRIVDVSTIKELCRRWFPLVSQQRTKGSPMVTKHRALDDIKGSIIELKYYRETIFKSPSSISTQFGVQGGIKSH